MSRPKLIIDTDPGVDDVMALLLALSAPSDEVDISMVSVTYGNVSRTHSHGEDRRANQKVTMFYKTVCLWYLAQFLNFCSAQDNWHGADGEDGLQNVHKVYPQFSPAKDWPKLFEMLGTRSLALWMRWPAAHREMLRLLRENPEDSITIVAMGPLTNVTLAAAEDPETFLRVKEVVVMGGAVHCEGNVTPVAEFNCAMPTLLPQHGPGSTMPSLHIRSSNLPNYPLNLPRWLELTLAPLDITLPHMMTKSYFEQQIKPHIQAGSPLALWTSSFIMATFDQMTSLQATDKETELSLHDPLTIWYAMTRDQGVWETTAKPEDLRVETTGESTRGMHVVDKRNRNIADDGSTLTGVSSELTDNILGDDMGWLNPTKGNRINRLIKSPGADLFQEHWMQRVFE
ncbi:unnamed protein product [Clonostachys byssicola]|uniref:Inosine/uridine-preferring nucleoside hydrolase domain-containing protein n=1 Tax=Clonostachys byssicola TaxID=160290 RepID=A0A9N9Y532_9HYPO|nr:unnamed protein product [Clonostachys byssicola]